MNKFFLTLSLMMLTLSTGFAQSGKRILVDGIAAVVGNEPILRSDIANLRLQMKEQGIDLTGMDDCALLETLLQRKVLISEALTDTTITQTINPESLRDQARQQLKYFEMQAGGLDKVLEMYHKKTKEELIDAITDFNYKNELFNAMQRKITEKVEITPDEIKRFFDSIPSDLRPEFPTQVQLRQIIVQPQPDSAEVERVKKRLNQIRENILKGETTFNAQAVFYSEDPGTRSQGGLMTIDRNTPLVKEFKDVAFSLDEGQISKPFRTSFGWHIVKVEKVKGRQREIRHILLIPKLNAKNLEEAKQKLEKIRKSILAGEMTFEEAAKNFSDDEESKKRGGLMIDPASGETLLETTKLDPAVYAQLVGRNAGDLTDVFEAKDPMGNVSYKLIKIDKKIPPHKADFVKDYAKISQMALEAKKQKAIIRWIKQHLKNTYIYIAPDYRKCKFKINWLGYEQ